MRRLLIATALLATGPASGQGAGPPGRFEIIPANGGFTRLDTRTGAVSHCAPRDDGVWYCEPLDAADPEFGERVDRLAAGVQDLSDAVAALSARIDSVAARVAAVDQHAGRIESLAAEVDALAARVEAAPFAVPPATGDAGRASSLVDEVVRRLFDMVRHVKRQDAGAV